MFEFIKKKPKPPPVPEATSEVLMTPLGQNVFDELGKKALFGRCFMFMDASRPIVTEIVRHAA